MIVRRALSESARFPYGRCHFVDFGFLGCMCSLGEYTDRKISFGSSSFSTVVDATGKFMSPQMSFVFGIAASSSPKYSVLYLNLLAFGGSEYGY